MSDPVAAELSGCNTKQRYSRRFLGLLGGVSLVTALVSWTDSARAQQPWPLWQAYTHHNVDGNGRVIDHSAGDKTTSEGQAYAMFFALVGNDRPRFDQLLAWTESNLAAGDLSSHLPAWEWGRMPNGAWKVRDSNSASDADLWMAYTLLEAGRLWHDPHLSALGRTLVQQIAHREVVAVPGIGTVLLPGPAGFGADTSGSAPRLTGDRVVLNPSYTPAPLLARLAHLFPDGPWGRILASNPALIGGPVSHGFAMDWVGVSGGMLTPASWPLPAAGQPVRPAVGSYDAIRVYLWAGISAPGTPGLTTTRARLFGMERILRAGASPPSVVDASGNVLHAETPPGFLACAIPYLASLGLTQQSRAQADRLAATRDAASGLYGPGLAYYDQNLALFSTGWTEHRFSFDRDGLLRVGWR